MFEEKSSFMSYLQKKKKSDQQVTLKLTSMIDMFTIVCELFAFTYKVVIIYIYFTKTYIYSNYKKI